MVNVGESLHDFRVQRFLKQNQKITNHIKKERRNHAIRQGTSVYQTTLLTELKNKVRVENGYNVYSQQ